MKNIFVLIAVFCCGILNAESITFFRDGKTDYTLTVPEKPSPMLQLAARELQNYWKKSSGSELKTGTGRESKQVILQYDSSLKREESEIKLKKDHLILSGGDDWGILYAVYNLLENQFGIRWYSAYGDELVPKHKELTVALNQYRAKPSYEIRGLIGSNYYKQPESSMFFLRNRLNFCNSLQNADYPGSDTLIKQNGGQCHTLFFYIPPAKGVYPQHLKFKEEKYYFAEHPEYFSMDAKGNRTKNLQLCFSNSGLRKEFTRRFFEYVELSGKKGMYSISAMDWPGHFCFCPECMALEKKYQCSIGPLLDYLIELCNIAKTQYPDILISTLAYRKEQSEKPPVLNGRLPDNFVVIFAPIDDDFSKTLDHKNNQETLKHLKEWANITKNTLLWYYPLTYGSVLPYGGVSRSAEDTRIMYEAGARGTYYEHDVGVFSGMNFADLMTWMFLKLFQNPHADKNALIKEFCAYYYGAASGDMIRYLTELDQATAENSVFKSWNSGEIRAAFDHQNLIRWTKIFNQMEQKTADDPKVFARIKDARIAFDVAVLQYGYPQLNKKYPDLFPPVDILGQKIRSSLDDSVNRRVPDSHKILRTQWKKSLASALENAMIIASVEAKPVPPPLDKVNPGKMRQVFAKAVNRCGFEKTPDAAFGQAIYDNKKVGVELPFSCGFYDAAGKRFLLNRKIGKEEIVPDRYHLYKIGEAPISSDCYLWTMSSWRAGISLSSLYTAGEAPDKKYEIWISLKFEGPGYHSASKAKVDRVWLDRAIVVEK